MKKRILLFALLIITITCLAAVTVSAAKYSGTCGANGSNLTWSLDTSTGVLKITGTGAMKNWSSYSSAPWYSYRSDIKSVTIGDSVTSIGERTFADCTSLTSVDIPDSVTSIGDSAFEYCTSLTSIAVDKANTKYSSDEYGVLFNKDKTTLIQYPIGNTRTSYSIPDSVTSIGERAFCYCTSLTSVDIPDSVTSIGDYAFEYCTSLTSVDIGFGVTSIGDAAFASCTSLTSVVIPDSVTSIGGWAFRYCDRLWSVTIPESVTSIGTYAFYGCHVTIYGYTGSYAETYANDNNIPFVALSKVLSGDVNADGKVDRKDLTRLAQYFARWSVEIDTDASDANGDGRVDRKDLTRLAQYFARWDVELGK